MLRIISALGLVLAIGSAFFYAYKLGHDRGVERCEAKYTALENAQLKDALTAASAANASVVKLNESMEAINAIPDSDCPMSDRVRGALDSLRPAL